MTSETLPSVPAFVRRGINLASAGLGAEPIFATDQFFAPLERMLKDEPAIFIPDKYDDNGKWMDGWESRRRRDGGHDFAIVRLAAVGEGARIAELTGQTTGEGFGIGPARAGDVDGDGCDDLIIGAWQFAGGAASGGQATLFSGASGEPIRTYTCAVENDTFGFDTSGMGDVDGDGAIDFLITSAWSGVGGEKTGRVFIISSEYVPRKLD